LVVDYFSIVEKSVAKENEVMVFENVGGVDENITS